MNLALILAVLLNGNTLPKRQPRLDGAVRQLVKSDPSEGSAGKENLPKRLNQALHFLRKKSYTYLLHIWKM
jgi:hypothetical protein